MTAATLTRSAYPTAVEDLIPLARDYAAELGTTPTRNQLMKRFRVGAPKANTLLASLTPAPVESEPALRPIVIVEDEMQRYFSPAQSPRPDADPDESTDADADPPLVIIDANGAAEWSKPLLSLAADPGTKIPTAETTPPVTDTPPERKSAAAPTRRPVTWPVLILCLPAFVAIWAGWVEMGRLTGFGKVVLLPGIFDRFVLDTAITLPIGVETYAAYALWVWLSGRVTGEARRFAKWSAIASLGLGGLGQVTYHLMNAWHWSAAPWPVTALVACIPVAVLGMGAALAHLMHADHA
jgi:hypothetical protein